MRSLQFMNKVRAIDILFLDDLFEMGSGYVLTFTDATFRNFFVEELQVDIYSALYSGTGTSKAKRLRCFLQIAETPTVVRALNALWEYREAVRLRAGKTDTLSDARPRLEALISRLDGKPITKTMREPIIAAISPHKLAPLQSRLIALADLEPQPRGYAFEVFLKDFFDVYGLVAREPFRLRGEQIDGSFQLSSETYLLEAKWQSLKSGVAELHTFQGKIEQKAAWTRGLFISNSGFTDDGLVAFGRGKRVVCMDGLDLYDTLNRALPLNDVLDKKVRRAAETGSPFISVRDLFPV
jgi:hypothetical protein